MKPFIPEEYTVEFEHYRYQMVQNPDHMDHDLVPGDLLIRSDTLRRDGSEISPRGGLTRCLVKDSEGRIVTYADAKCHTNDNFSRKLGRLISSGRAAKKLAVGDSGPRVEIT